METINRQWPIAHIVVSAMFSLFSDAFFFIGDKNGGPAAPSGQGTIMMDQYGRCTKSSPF